MTLRIVPATSRRDVRRFVDFQYALYDREIYPNWVAPLRVAVRDALDARTNPFYREADRALFLAERDGRVVGRIAAIENRAHNRFHGDRTGFWGFFECVNDQATADALFDAAAEWLSGRGLETMRGPMNPSTNYECGLLVQGFDNRPSFMTAWNPQYYGALFRTNRPQVRIPQMSQADLSHFGCTTESLPKAVKCLIVLAEKEVVGSVWNERLITYVGGDRATLSRRRSPLGI